MQINNLIFIICFFRFLSLYSESSFVIMIDIAGDIYSQGRIIDNHFERGLLLQLAEKIKTQCAYSSIQVIINTSQEPEAKEQRAHKINTIGIDLLISICAYHDKLKRQIFIYQYGDNKSLWSIHDNSLSFLPFDKAYSYSLVKTDSYVQYFCKLLGNSILAKEFIMHEPLSVYLKSLSGIIIPAFCIEFGFIANQDWLLLIEPISLAIQSMLHDYMLSEI